MASRGREVCLSNGSLAVVTSRGSDFPSGCLVLESVWRSLVVRTGSWAQEVRRVAVLEFKTKRLSLGIVTNAALNLVVAWARGFVAALRARGSLRRAKPIRGRSSLNCARRLVVVVLVRCGHNLPGRVCHAAASVSAPSLSIFAVRIVFLGIICSRAGCKPGGAHNLLVSSIRPDFQRSAEVSLKADGVAGPVVLELRLVGSWSWVFASRAQGASEFLAHDEFGSLANF